MATVNYLILSIRNDRSFNQFRTGINRTILRRKSVSAFKAFPVCVRPIRSFCFSCFPFSRFNVVDRLPVKRSVTHRYMRRTRRLTRVILCSQYVDSKEGWNKNVISFPPRGIPVLLRIVILSNNRRFSLGRKRVVRQVTFSVVSVIRLASAFFRRVHRFRLRLVNQYAQVNDYRRYRLCLSLQVFRLARLVTNRDSTHRRGHGRGVSRIPILGSPFTCVRRGGPPAFILRPITGNQAFSPSSV